MNLLDKNKLAMSSAYSRGAIGCFSKPTFHLTFESLKDDTRSEHSVKLALSANTAKVYKGDV